MKKTLVSIFSVLFLISGLYLPNTFAQDHIPEGAKARLGKGRINEIAYSPDGTRLAVAGSIGIWIYDAQTGEALDLLSGHTSWIYSVSFSPDGQTLATGSTDDTVRLWDVNTGDTLRTLTGHTADVYSVSFSPDGQTLATGSEDGTVLLWDLTPSSSPQLPEDVNGDGIVNIQDLVPVAAALGEVAAALAQHPQVLKKLTAAEVQGWLTAAAAAANLTDAKSQRGIRFLEALLAALTPKKTTLLANYPNPFNPETWIPYQLAEPTDVSISIYAADGRLVRTLALGHKPVGIYESRSRAASWDGRNAVGEPVASGVYFYTLTAGDFTATRKMLITK